MSGDYEGAVSISDKSTRPARTSSSARFTAQFATVNSIDYLNYDQRPTFVLDLEAYKVEKDPFSPLAFCNSALLGLLGLHEVVSRTFAPKATERQREDERAFAAWVIHQCVSKRVRKSKTFFDTLWTVVSTSDDWAVISGVELSQSDFGSFNAVSDSEKNSLHDIEMPNASSRNSLSVMDTDLRSDNAYQPPRAQSGTVWPPARLGSSTHTSLIMDFEWASTSLGSIATWSSQLRQACEMMLVCPDPVALFWGPDLIMLYNEAYIAIAANKHPGMMGGSARVQWEEIWDVYDPLFNQVRVECKALKQAKAQVYLQRIDHLEEGFFSIVVLPMLGDDGSVIGFYETVSDITKQTLSERRMHTLLKVSECTITAGSLTEFWHLLLKVLSGYLDCFHFAILYSLQYDESSTKNPHYGLEGAIGFTGDTSSLHSTISVNDLAHDGIIPAIRKAHDGRAVIVLNRSDQSLSPSILGELDSAGLKEPPRVCIVCPLSSGIDESIDAFLIIGIPPTRDYDADYRLFIDLLTRQVESTTTFVKLFEKERERMKQQAIYESELKFKRFAETAPVGIFICDPAGNITFCNESWLEMTGHDRNNMSAKSWAHDVHPDSTEELAGRWHKLVGLKESQAWEIAYKKPWTPPGRVDDLISLDRTWASAQVYPEFSEEGEFAGLIGCVTDISSWKWADIIHSQRLSEALELKRQQENFLDITSHESVSHPLLDVQSRSCSNKP